MVPRLFPTNSVIPTNSAKGKPARYRAALSSELLCPCTYWQELCSAAWQHWLKRCAEKFVLHGEPWFFSNMRRTSRPWILRNHRVFGTPLCQNRSSQAFHHLCALFSALASLNHSHIHCQTKHIHDISWCIWPLNSFKQLTWGMRLDRLDSSHCRPMVLRSANDHMDNKQ